MAKKLLLSTGVVCAMLVHLGAAQVPENTVDMTLLPYPEKPLLEGKLTAHERSKNFIEEYPEWTEKDKISYLLKGINDSGMRFIRNGSEYKSNQAMRWLAWKIRHRQFRKNPISTAEDFVKRVATRSNNSGLYYELMTSEGKRVRVRDVLSNELYILEQYLEAELLNRMIKEEEVVAEQAVQEQLQTAVIVPPTPTPSS